MAKFYGPIGYGNSVETSPGVWNVEYTELPYSGDFIRNTSKLQIGVDVNFDNNISTEISIVSDPYAMENYRSMKYVTYMGTKWSIRSVEIQYPRLILTIGGVYNGEQT